MGREAFCTCVCNGAEHKVKVLLEPPELIVRGEIRRKIPIARVSAIKADGEVLSLKIDSDLVRLYLGGAMAAKWAEALLKPPPSLAKKLGISCETTVRVIGPMDDGALEKALADAKGTSASKGNLILARVDTPADLAAALRKAAAQLAEGVPIWFIYRKGPGHALNENLVRSRALDVGIVDTKVSAVSRDLTALRFVKRRG